MFCRHQTVLETQPTTSSNYYNTTSICKAYIFWHTGVEGHNKNSFVSTDSHDHNNTHQLTNIACAVNEIDVYHSFLT